VTRPAAERVVLTGLPGSGKSTIGPILARLLGWTFVDVDAHIVAHTGSTIAELFRDLGETGFRSLELQLTVELSSRSRCVLAPGGGWAAQPGSLESLPAGSAVVWLRVAPEEALRRIEGTHASRPLLAGDDPLAAIRQLDRLRSARYAQADRVVDVDNRTSDAVAMEICEWLKSNTS
jgi:shikimate kinase